MIKNLWSMIKRLWPTGHKTTTLGVAGMGALMATAGFAKALTPGNTVSVCVMVIGLVLIALSAHIGTLSANLTKERSKAILAKAEKKTMIMRAKVRRKVTRRAAKKARTFNELLTLLRVQNADADLPEGRRMADDALITCHQLQTRSDSGGEPEPGTRGDGRDRTAQEQAAATLADDSAVNPVDVNPVLSVRRGA